MNSNNESTLLALSLIEDDKNKINNLISEVTVNAKTLRMFFRDLLCFSALYQRCSWSKDGVVSHPLIQLNALKNLASLRLEKPSKAIVKRAITISQKSIKPKIAIKSSTFNDAELNKPLLTQEFISAFKHGDIEKARIEASRISIISDNPSSVIEIIMEIAIMYMDQLGAFVYSVYRSSIFSGSKQSHIFINLLLSALGNRQWPVDLIEEKKFSELSPFMEYVLQNSNFSEFNLFSIAMRLWNGESVRKGNFRQGLYAWGEKKFDVLTDLELNINLSTINYRKDIIHLLKKGNPDYLSNALIRAQSNNKWTWPLNVVELWIESSKSHHLNFDHLDALQSIARVADPKSMRFIAKRLLEVNSRSV
tara:strand:+ start:2789 stop:3880 length:1092 start_codon:yes stop_codon:yes gene_type:complete